MKVKFDEKAACPPLQPHQEAVAARFLRFGRVLMRHDVSQKWVIYGIHALGSCHYSGDEPEDLRYLVFRQTDVLLCGRWNSDMEGLC